MICCSNRKFWRCQKVFRNKRTRSVLLRLMDGDIYLAPLLPEKLELKTGRSCWRRWDDTGTALGAADNKGILQPVTGREKMRLG